MKGVVLHLKNEALERFLQIEDLSVEDKLFLNRIAYLVFQRLGAEAVFEDFYKLCKVMQEGTFEQRLLLLLDFAVEGDDVIDVNNLEQLLVASLIKDANRDFFDLKKVVLDLLYLPETIP